MKTNHYYLLLLMALFMLPMNAQENSSSSDVTVVQAFDFFITEPVSSFPQVNVSDIPAREIPRGQMSQRRQNRADELNAAGNSPSQVDPLIQNGGFTRSDPRSDWPGFMSQCPVPNQSLKFSGRPGCLATHSYS